MAMAPEQVGIGIRRHFTRAGEHPYDSVAWEKRDARIPNYKSGGDAFFQAGVEFPVTWSQNATNIVAQKYFRGQLGTPGRESSLRQVIDRVSDTIADWGVRDGYFVDEAEADAFRDELKYLLVHQRAAFNSPVWFNIGVKGVPAQASACQPYHALVSTVDGLVPIGRLVEENAVGTKVFDAQGVTSIVAVKANGTKPVLRIHTKAGYTLDVTPDHLVWRVSGTGAGRFVEAGELKPADKLEWHRTESWGAGTFDSSEVAEAALAGWLQCDGFVGQYEGTNRSLTIEAMTVTAAELAWVTAAIDKVFPSVHRHERKVVTRAEDIDCRRTRLYGRALADFVNAWGLRARGVEMEIPSHLFTAPLPVVAAYLRSVFQAEGYVSIRERAGVVGVDMISEQIVRGVQQLLLRFGIYSRVRFKADARPDRKDCWSLSIRTAGDRRRFADEIGFIDARKAEKLETSFDLPNGLAAKATKTLEIDWIEPIGEMEVYDIQTESGEYLSGNLRVHNCFILAVEDEMSSILNWYVEEGTIFKGGSGSGINLSNIRSSVEPLAGGGTASGPVSFMRGADASAGTIKCLHADTELVTDHGSMAIRSVAPGWQVLTRHGFRTVTAVHDNGVRPLVRVRTALGDEILCTPEHRFRVRTTLGEMWRQAGELGPDDYVVVDLAHTDAGSPQRLVADGADGAEVVLPDVLDEAFAVWLGWAHGEGRLRPVPGSGALAVHLDGEDKALVERYRAFTTSVFGRRAVAGMSTARGGAAPPATLCAPAVARFLRDNGLWRVGAASVPRPVRSSPAAVRAAFLAGLFESDGHVQHGCPTLWTRRRELALDVHRLLLSVGIPSKVSQARPPASVKPGGPGVSDRAGELGEDDTAPGAVPTSGPGLWRVRVVGGEGVRRFAKLVGFVSEGKARLLETALAVAKEEPEAFEASWFFPHVDAELDRLGFAVGASLRAAIGSYRHDAHPYGMSLPRAAGIAVAFPAELEGALARFAQGEELYVPVSVEPAGEGPTFDLTVADVHEYLVHSVVTHNSGGKTRRAAKMVILNADHPDVEHFIWCKAVEERKARALAAAGFDMDLDGVDSHSTQYQNANNSVRVTDEFMQAVVDDDDWDLKAVKTGEAMKTLKARALLRQIAEAAWECADPGMQFDTTINRWHTASNTGRINASNPCAEYVHLDNSACNLASMNLMRFLNDDGTFDVEGFKAAVEVIFTAQEILVGNADYPTKKIGENARSFRQLGIGYANLGALLMAQGLPYDSDEGRAWAAAITSLLTGHAYATSARTAGRMGPFAGYAKNKEPMLNVLRMHRAEVDKIDTTLAPAELVEAAGNAWDDAVEIGETHGVRNSQASVLAPTGCLVGGSLLATDQGLVRLRSLGDPDGPRWQDLNVDVLTDEGTRSATRFYVNGLEPVVDVNTARGYRIQGTTKHRIKVVDARGEWVWRRFVDLRAGDRVPLALGQIVGNPQPVSLPPLAETSHWTGEHHVRVPRRMTPELAELVGYFMGDGSLHAKGLRLCVSNTDPDVVDHLELLVKSLFGIGTVSRQQQGYTSVEANSVRLSEWWEACGFAKRMPSEGHWGKGYKPHVPDAVLHSNDPEVYRAFLRGLHEADGTVTAGYPSWTTTSLEFSHDVQTVLLALGFVTTRKFDTSGRGSRLAVLRLLNKSVNARWLEQIGFISARKARSVDTGDCLQSARYDHIPVSRELIDRVAPDNDRNRKVALMEFRRSGTITRRVAEELLAVSGDAELDRLLRFFYDTVTSAELGEEELTYDLSVPENVTYVANGFVSHNTIGLMMDCDTTGVEPDLALTKAKKLVGGGTMFIVNQTVPRALRRLGYSDEQVEAIVAWIDEHKTILGAPGLRVEHLPVFACAMGDNTIHYMGHVKMMAAVQPSLSGSISKTINMPEEATVEEIEDLHIEAWKLGLKAIAIYRDNCKVAQPLSTQKKAEETVVREVERVVETIVLQEPVRQKLPRKRNSKTYSFRVADCHGYATVGEYEDGRPGEIFLKVAKQGSTMAGIMDAFAISVSHGLQYGVPLKAFVEMFINMRFEPAGITDDPEIRLAASLVDYIFRRLAVEYLPYEDRVDLGILTVGERTQPTLPGVEEASIPPEPSLDLTDRQSLPPSAPPSTRATAAPGPQAAAVPEGTRRIDAPYCYNCGMEMQRAGSCYVCSSCGATSGCS